MGTTAVTIMSHGQRRRHRGSQLTHCLIRKLCCLIRQAQSKLWTGARSCMTLRGVATQQTTTTCRRHPRVRRLRPRCGPLVPLDFRVLRQLAPIWNVLRVNLWWPRCCRLRFADTQISHLELDHSAPHRAALSSGLGTAWLHELGGLSGHGARPGAAQRYQRWWRRRHEPWPTKRDREWPSAA